jgi:hypothetical protein
MQIAFMHSNLFEFNIGGGSGDSLFKASLALCTFFDSYLFEELIYFSAAVGIFVLIIFTRRENRFNEYIYEKHKDYLRVTRYHKPVNDSLTHESGKSSALQRFWQRIRHVNMPSPTTPFSITNRAATSAIYILYTYDILNILMSVYTDNLSESFMSVLVPNVSNFTGVIVDFVFQILQVCLIGVKFYPLLIVLDLNSVDLMINLFTTGYVLFVWLSGLTNKALCSQREGFFKRNLFKLSKNFYEKFTLSLKSKYNMTNSILGLITDEPDASEKYISQLKNSVPRIFNHQFFNTGKLFFHKISGLFYLVTGDNWSRQDDQ